MIDCMNEGMKEERKEEMNENYKVHNLYYSYALYNKCKNTNFKIVKIVLVTHKKYTSIYILRQQY